MAALLGLPLLYLTLSVVNGLLYRLAGDFAEDSSESPNFPIQNAFQRLYGY
jgi:hypothetical protein